MARVSVSVLADPDRLRAIKDLMVTDGRRDEVFDSSTRLASKVLGAPVALVSIVTDDRQVFTSQVGLAEPWAERGETPLSHSFCQYVVKTDSPLRIVDARESELVKNNLAIPDLGVVAYYGVPLHAPSGETIGSFCVIDGAPRDWTDDDLETLRDLASLVEHVMVSRQASSLLLDSIEERGNLVATLAHDIRQPLSAASMATSLLQRGMDSLPENTRGEIVETLVRQVERVDKLLGQLTDPKRPDVRAVDLVRVASDLARACAASRQGIVKVDVPAGMRVLGVATDVERVVSNLVRNAFVHGGEGVTVTVSASRTDEGVSIEVADDGRGIASDDLERIFKFRAQGSEHGEGRGLGLHIVRALARQTGGEVSVTSVEGKGATFRVHLHDVEQDPAKAELERLKAAALAGAAAVDTD